MKKTICKLKIDFPEVPITQLLQVQKLENLATLEEALFHCIAMAFSDAIAPKFAYYKAFEKEGKRDTTKLQNDYQELKNASYQDKRIWEIIAERMKAGFYGDGK